MKVYLDQAACIGCGVCSQVSPENFAVDAETGVARVLREETDDLAVKEAENSCPIGCIRVE